MKITDQYCLDFKFANDNIFLYQPSSHREDTIHLIRMADLSAICCLSSVHPIPAFVTGNTARVQYFTKYNLFIIMIYVTPGF